MRYYARRSNGWPDGGTVVNGPFQNYDQAAKNNADFLARHAIPIEYRPTFEVLFDVTSLKIESEEQLRELLLTDPALRAVFEYGMRHGAKLTEKRHNQST